MQLTNLTLHKNDDIIINSWYLPKKAERRKLFKLIK